jgi:hypothetical protein
VSTPSPFLVAGAPELLAAITAAQTFIVNLGSDPLKLPLTAGPALQVFAGTLGLQVPALATAEFGAVQAAVIAQLQAAATKLKAATA